MSEHYGDIQLGDTVQWLFTTVGTDGAPTVLTGSPTATAYTDGGVTQSATGVTLTADFDGVVGLNQVSVVASSGNGFAAGENIEIVLDAGTVGGTTVVGYAVGSFSIENRSNLRPTTVGNNEVDVTATGAVGIDWANVENKTAVVDLTQTDIQLVDTASVLTGHTPQTADHTAGIADIPTVAEFNARTIVSANYALEATLGTPAGASISVDIAAIPIIAEFNARTLPSASYALEASIGALNDVAATDIVSAGAIITLAGAIANVDLVDTLTTYTGDTPQTGDNFALIGTAGINLTNLGSMSTAMKAQVNAECNLAVVDVMTVDVQTLPGQIAPPLTPTFADMAGWVYKSYRNRETQTATEYNLFADDGTTVDTKATVSDDSTTFDKNELVSGP